MATVVVTFVLFVRLYISKMDADFKEGKRTKFASQREKRWSMSSQRLEEIVATLLRPLGDYRQSFNTDLCGLLEGYLTEAGVHALDAEAADGPSAVNAVAPNYAEVALLLQQSAYIYCRKVDYLYDHVVNVSDSLYNSTSDSSTPDTQRPNRSCRRKNRNGSPPLEFTPITLQQASAARREAPPRPPPTLARGMGELHRRSWPSHYPHLRSHHDDDLGVLADLHIGWRLQGGQLVQDLSLGPEWPGRPEREGREGRSGREGREGSASPWQCLTPPHSPLAPLAASTPLPALPPPATVRRKRRIPIRIQDLPEDLLHLLTHEDVLSRLRAEESEFRLPVRWVSYHVSRRKVRILALRQQLRNEDEEVFHGFESSSIDVDGFLGWSESEAVQAHEEAEMWISRRPDDDDDDGFFELTSAIGDDYTLDSQWAQALAQVEWRSSVLAAAAEASARPACLEQLAASVLAALPDAAPAPAPAPAPPTSDPAPSTSDPGPSTSDPGPSTSDPGPSTSDPGPSTSDPGPSTSDPGPSTSDPAPAPEHPFVDVLRETAEHPSDVSRLFLATLFLADTGNVEIVPGAPLTPNSFSLRVVSRDRCPLMAMPACSLFVPPYN